MNELDEALIKTVLGEPQAWKVVVNYGTIDSSVAIHMAVMNKNDSFNPCCYYWENELGQDWEIMFGFIMIKSGLESEKQMRRRLNRYCLKKLRDAKNVIKYMRNQGANEKTIREKIKYIIHPEAMKLGAIIDG